MDANGQGADDLVALRFEGVGEVGDSPVHSAEDFPIFGVVIDYHKVLVFLGTNISQIIDNSKGKVNYLNISGFLVLTNSSENSPSHHTTCSTRFGEVMTFRLMS